MADRAAVGGGDVIGWISGPRGGGSGDGGGSGSGSGSIPLVVRLVKSQPEVKSNARRNVLEADAGARNSLKAHSIEG